MRTKTIKLSSLLVSFIISNSVGCKKTSFKSANDNSSPITDAQKPVASNKVNNKLNPPGENGVGGYVKDSEGNPVTPPTDSDCENTPSKCPQTTTTPTTTIIVPPQRTVPQPPPQGVLVTEEIKQDQYKLDILWVIDGSKSMEWAQNQITKKFNLFINQLQSKGTAVDYHLAVTTANMCKENGEEDEYCPIKSTRNMAPLRGKIRHADDSFGDTEQSLYLTNKTIKLEEKFAAVAKVGIYGSPYEHGLSSALEVIKLSQKGKYNSGFLREGVPLNIIVLSDEEDQGVEFWQNCDTANPKDKFDMPHYGCYKSYQNNYPMSAHSAYMTYDKFISEVPKYKGDSKFSVSAITGLPDANGNIVCAKADGPKEIGTNYINAASATSGALLNLCADDDKWDTLMITLGVNSLKNISTINLKKRLYPGKEIIVKVNNVVVPKSSYVISEFNNTIMFNQEQIPNVDAMISITYYTY